MSRPRPSAASPRPSKIPGLAKLDAKDLLDLARAAEAEYRQRLDAEDGLSVEQPHLISTVDLALAAFFHFKGVPLVKLEPRGNASRGGRHQDFRFHFAMSEETAARLRLQWLNSEHRLYDSSVRHLKKECGERRRYRD